MAERTEDSVRSRLDAEPPRLGQLVTQGIVGRARARVDLELPQQPLDVGRRRVMANEEGRGDLAVGTPRRKQAQHVPFPAGERPTATGINPTLFGAE